MFDYKQIKMQNTAGDEERNTYFEGIISLIANMSEEASQKRTEFMSPERLKNDREAYREKFINMLGWPLNEYTHEYKPKTKKYLVEDAGFLKIYRLIIETLPNIWFEGLIFEPKEHEENPPLVVINPGGGYLSEELIAHGDFDNAQYKCMGGRFAEAGCIVYAPQLLLWNDERKAYKQPGMRQLFDVKLKAMGGSITALEIFNIKRAIDYFIGNEPIDENRIGMMGLSYGGFYTLYTSAAEPRVKSVFSSCFFCDRFATEREGSATRSDWLWQNSANTFFDAEVAALIAPRALYIENGIKDELFPIELSKKEFERLKPYYEAQNASDKLMYHAGDNGHEVSVGDVGFDFFIKNLRD